MISAVILTRPSEVLAQAQNLPQSQPPAAVATAVGSPSATVFALAALSALLALAVAALAVVVLRQFLRTRLYQAVFSSLHPDLRVRLLWPDGRIDEAATARLQSHTGGQRGFGHLLWDERWLVEGEAQIERLRAAQSRAAAGETMRRREPLRRANGRVAIMDVCLRPLGDGAGKVHHVLASGIDVSERVDALARARDSEARFRSIFDLATVGIALVGEAERWQAVNARLCEITGYAAEELLKTDVRSLTHPHDRDSDIELAARIDSGQIYSYEVDKRLLRKDGEIVWVRQFVRRVDATAEAPGYWVCVFEDLSERRTTEERLNNLAANLEVKVAERTLQLQKMMELAQRRNAELETVTEMTGLLAAAHDVDDAAMIVARYLPQLFPQTAGALYFDLDQTGRFLRQAQWGDFEAAVELIEIQDCWALRRCQEHRVAGANDPLQCDHLPDLARTRPHCCTPLVALGDVTGVLTMSWEQAQAEPEAVLLRTISEQIGLAISNVRLRDELRGQAFFDPLTGLYNRRGLDDYLQRCLAGWQRKRRGYAILALDLDFFKAINDTYGHDGGDQLLRQIGNLLKRTTRAHDAAFRLGGEEFLVVVDGDSLEEFERCAERIRAAIQQMRVVAHGRPLPQVTSSIGMAVCPEDGEDPQELLRCADRALYRAKNEGRNRVCRFDAQAMAEPVVAVPVRA